MRKKHAFLALSIWVGPLSLSASAQTWTSLQNTDFPYPDPFEATVASAFVFPSGLPGYPPKLYQIPLIEGRLPLDAPAWIRPTPSPLVLILPGTGSAAFSDRPKIMAERLGEQGYSVASLPSVFHPDWVKWGSTSPLPGDTVHDAADLYVGVKKFLEVLEAKHPGAFTSVTLMGFSLGALHALHMSKLDSDGMFERIIAVHPPMDLEWAVLHLDAAFEEPFAELAAAGKIQRGQELLTRLAMSLLRGQSSEKIFEALSEDETRFLIGYKYRMDLSRVVAAAQERRPELMGLELSSPLHQELEALEKYGFRDYLEHLLIPARHQALGMELSWEAWIERVGFEAISEAVAQNPKVRVFHARDDFLMNEEGWTLLQQTVGPRLTLFDHGGHMGQVDTPAFSQVLLGALPPIRTSEGP